MGGPDDLLVEDVIDEDFGDAPIVLSNLGEPNEPALVTNPSGVPVLECIKLDDLGEILNVVSYGNRRGNRTDRRTGPTIVLKGAETLAHGQRS